LSPTPPTSATAPSPSPPSSTSISRSATGTLYQTLDEATAKVTAADVKRVANLYFDEDQSTTGWFIALKPEAPKAAPAAAK